MNIKKKSYSPMHVPSKPGYILFLLFTILSVCSVLMSLFFSKVVIYRQLGQQTIRQQQATSLALSTVSLAQAVLTPSKKSDNPEPKAGADDNLEKTVLINLFPFLNKEKKYELTSTSDGVFATISMSIQSEQGKLNINSLYDFEKKKFMYEGQANDRKKICAWLFGRIAAITGKPTLMTSFEEYLKSRSTELSDVTELLSAKDFLEQFSDALFFNPESSEGKKLFLTDIFTVYSEQETMNPWLFSYSWCSILDLKPKQNIPQEEIQKIFSSFKKDAMWETDWNSSLGLFYQKEYKDLAQEIKSILTTRYEANIFSLLLKAKIIETTSTIFTIVKANTRQHLSGFDIVKTYQIDETK